jgi:hypothetical protein
MPDGRGPAAASPRLRRVVPAFVALVLLLGAAPGCRRDAPPPVAAIGRAGTGDGEFSFPRGLSVSGHGLLVVDKTGRMLRFDLAGRFLGSVTIVPGNVRRGLPIGIDWLPDGGVAIAHTHESRILLLSPAFAVAGTFGKEGIEPGSFFLPQRIRRDASGRFLVCDHGISIQRVQVLAADGSPLLVFGGPDPADGGLRRPMGCLVLPDGDFLVADQGAGLVRFAPDGTRPRRFSAVPDPPDAVVQGVCADDAGNLYVADLARCEIRRYGADGRPLGRWGRRGIGPGELSAPWDVAWHGGTLYVADEENHRVVTVAVDSVTWEVE